MRSYLSKMVSSTRLPPREERETAIEAAGYNVFNLDAEAVYIDLLTDSGTGTMSDEQWAALFRGDEAYAGSSSFRAFEEAVESVMGFEHVVPAHQGRGAENVLYGTLFEDGDVVPNNTHFDTTRAHVANAGANPVDCPVEDAMDPDAPGDFKGNLDLDCVRALADEHGAESIPAIVLTITNNSAAGQPVSVENTREASALAEELDVPLVVDACRFAENAHFVKQREAEFANASVAEIAREQLSYADAVVMSAKKDGITNIGGFVAVRDPDLFEQVKQRAILYEGFTTYGGMAGRDLEALAVGLREAVEDEYVTQRVGQTQALGDALDAAGVPIYQPVGGHAVYLDAEKMVPEVPASQFPGQALVVELYRQGGVRAVELGSFAFPGTDRPELVRLALPRRTYHREHIDHVVETAAAVLETADSVPGYEIVAEPPNEELRHFSAELKPV
ncbi:tryptophanase [Halodesulfurarchaeum formicicum]|uniref:Tryptophanase n=1 Tax=Halodesulfurarchaeum formicicum TaxID=1873524 RepID=A0A1D8S1L1_9EURY|nr:tryptophanase [Halodesulfurarchaeum formicicum]AOW79223.1 tryptophanase [Halodesulfurarchaeum formicicum]